MSSKNNVNADHYKTAGRGRPWEGAAAGLRKRPPAKAGAAEIRLGKLRRRQRLRRLANVKGLTARQLSERRMRLRQAGLG